MAYKSYSPHDVTTWWLEVFPIFLVVPLVWAYGRRGLLSPLLQMVIICHGAILALGGHYTYELVPLGNWVRDLGIGMRNNYDKVGHFAQGFVWDTQTDMATALVGAIIGIAIFAKSHASGILSPVTSPSP